MHIVFGGTRLVWGAVASIALIVGCATPPQPLPQPPADSSTTATKWEYAAYLLSNGKAAGAREYLEPLAGSSQSDVSDPALLWRDVTEARLFSGDLSGAVTAAGHARQELDAEPNTAQFNADDRFLFKRTIDALEAAAGSDSRLLETLAADERVAPSADAWYLLGWQAEQRGDLTSARAAYRAFLDRAPQWAFLRQAFVMHRHAQLFAQ